jgi:hypothetical protein
MNRLNTLCNRFSGKTCQAKHHTSDYYDEDFLVDYEEPRKKKLPKELLAKQLEKCKKKIVDIKRSNSSSSLVVENPHFNYKLDYTEKGSIKRPAYYIESTGETYSIPITMDVIRSIILKQHCCINKQEEIDWFEDGLRWLSQQHYQNSSVSSKYTYYIEEEKNYSDGGWNEKRSKKYTYQEELEDLERSCEAYFGIPLGLCEDHWAAEYLMNQASKGKLLRRVALKNSIHKFKFNVKKLFCCGL